MMGLTFTIIGDVFSPAERGRYVGLFSGMWGLASIFGPTLGGWLTDNWTWRAVFYVNLPVGVIAILAIYFEFPYFHPQGVRKQLDWKGVLALSGTLVPLLLALTWVTPYGWGSPRVEALLAFSAVMLVVFLRAESRAVEPVIPLSLFRDSVISLCSIAVFALGMGMFGVIFYLPLFMQGVLGVSATKSGSLLTPLMMGAVVGSILSGQFTSRYGKYKILAILGSVLVAVGMILFARMDGSTLPVQVLYGMVTAGLGMGFLNPVYTMAVQNAAPREHIGAATASTVFFRSIGSTLGVAVFGSILLTIYKSDFAAGLPRGLQNLDLRAFYNPLLLPQQRPQLEAVFARYPDGMRILNDLFANVRTALIHGLGMIFFVAAVMMTIAVVFNSSVPERPLRGRATQHKPAVMVGE